MSRGNAPAPCASAARGTSQEPSPPQCQVPEPQIQPKSPWVSDAGALSRDGGSRDPSLSSPRSGAFPGGSRAVVHSPPSQPGCTAGSCTWDEALALPEKFRGFGEKQPGPRAALALTLVKAAEIRKSLTMTSWQVCQAPVQQPWGLTAEQEPSTWGVCTESPGPSSLRPDLMVYFPNHEATRCPGHQSFTGASLACKGPAPRGSHPRNSWPTG